MGSSHPELHFSLMTAFSQSSSLYLMCAGLISETSLKTQQSHSQDKKDLPDVMMGCGMMPCKELRIGLGRI